MSSDELVSALGRLRWRLRGNAHLFEDPASYVDGVEDAFELLAQELVGPEDDDPGTDALEKTAS